MPTLHWIGKDKVINHHLDVPFKVLDYKYTYGSNENDSSKQSENKIIHGDNLEALKSLLPQYEGKVDCIYIDPPYNTGNESWVYNDNVNDPKIKKWLGDVVGKEGEDLSRHDKWLCMMYPRLKLLQRLLADTGAIFISIDDNEQANLKLLCDEIFGAGNFVAQIIVQSNSAKNNANFISITHEYAFIYCKNILRLPKNWSSKKTYIEEFSKRARFLTDKKLPHDEIHKELLALTKYPRFFDFDHYTYSDEKGAFRASDLTAPNSKNFYDVVHPVTSLPCKTGTRGWAYSEEQMNMLIEEDRVFFGEDETKIPQLKNHLIDNEYQVPRSVVFFDSQSTTKWVKAQKFNFAFPKPIELIMHLLTMYLDKNALILDSFAGSGTTAHAVLNLNKEDGGNRKFILIEMEEYAETITAERVRRVIDGYGDTEGTGGDFNFYTLGAPLLIKSQYINEDVPLETLREHIFFTETSQVLPLEAGENKYFLGSYNLTDYYFYYEKNVITTLDDSFLKTITQPAEGYLIYADICTLSELELAKHGIRFKKIPRDITKL